MYYVLFISCLGQQLGLGILGQGQRGTKAGGEANARQIIYTSVCMFVLRATARARDRARTGARAKVGATAKWD